MDRERLQTLTDVDTTYKGRLKQLIPFKTLIAAEGAAVHSVIEANGKTILGVSTKLKYLDTDHTHEVTNPTINGADICFAQAGAWLFMCDSTGKHALYLTNYTLCGWGINPPAAAPTVADSGDAGDPDGTYICYYRYKITLPDASIIYTDCIEGRSRLATWLYRVAYNASVDRLRDQKKLTPVPAEDGDEAALPMPTTLVSFRRSPEAMLRDAETRQALDEAIQGLPHSLRAAFLLRDVEGLTTAEAAEALGLSETNLKVRLHRARLLLRERLSAFVARGSGEARA